MMAGASPFVLPQFQGSLYDLQRQQALASALMQGAMTQPQAPQAGTSGQYTVAAHMSPLAPLSNIAQGLLSAKTAQNVAQGMNNLGLQQQQMLLGTPGGMGAMSGALSNMGAGDSPPLPQPPAGQLGAAAGTAGGPDAAAGNAGVSNQLSQQQGSPGLLEPGGPMNPVGMPKQQAYMMLMQSPDKYWEAQAAAFKPAEIVQQIRATGIDPNSPFGRQIAQQALAKSNYIAPTSLRPGGYMYDPMSGTMQQMPNVPEGFTAMRGQNGQWQIVPVQGALEAMGASAAAKAGGTAQYQLKEVWDPSANGGQGGYVQQSVSNVANAANGAGMRGVPSGGLAGIFAQQESNGGRTAPDNPFQIQQGTFNQYAQKGESWNNVADRNTVAQRVLNTYNERYGGDLGRIATAYFSGDGNVAPAGSPTPFLRNVSDRNGKSVASYVGDILGRAGGGSPQSGPMASQPQAGYTKGQEDLQGDLTKKWGSLNEANSQAQNTISYLQNIHDLASKAALGQQSDKLNYINGLLSLAGSEKATNMVTANNLLDKYSNQIVARLGTGGLGTDAARAILQSAYPNAHMTKGAIDEAVQNLVGASQMTQAKARLLQGDYNSRNPQAYNQKEMVFDQNADPRIWQYKNISDPNARKAFAKEVLQQDPNFGSKIKALESIGAL
ncbi:lytic transglycosylase domain-containing protein [Burkholderia sp. B21-007]|uniref:lytic transglycosylase domain-containing protein n=1 Tax=Burkholderia sp. B21-007 TaxID=2890407 RepID=UPI001E4837C6|nr:lytic transglycosylase domain-containing protein [Burkholderia sp. B21-007]UEP31617.1 lytic transglycosylase domain-containing protein [Burkholderia sp. B21-007]